MQQNKKNTWFFAYDGCHNYFWKKNCKFNIVDYWIVHKVTLMHNWGDGWENKLSKDESELSKDECEIFTIKLGWIISPSF
jgi:hypothetical protein